MFWSCICMSRETSSSSSDHWFRGNQIFVQRWVIQSHLSLSLSLSHLSLSLSLGGHGGRPPAERQPESELLRPAGHLPADQRGERPEPAGPAEGGSARVPDAVFTRHQLDPAVHRLQSSRGTKSHTFYLSLFRWICFHVKIYWVLADMGNFFSRTQSKMVFMFPFQPLLTEMMERCKKLGNKWVLNNCVTMRWI